MLTCVCKRSKNRLAARVPHQLARLPRPVRVPAGCLRLGPIEKKLRPQRVQEGLARQARLLSACKTHPAIRGAAVARLRQLVWLHHPYSRKRALQYQKPYNERNAVHTRTRCLGADDAGGKRKRRLYTKQPIPAAATRTTRPQPPASRPMYSCSSYQW